MKAVEIHNSLDKKEIRDFLGKELHDLSTITSIPECLEQKIIELQNELKQCRRKQALIELINYLGWEEFDVSVEITDYDWDTYIDFIGTEEEYKSIILQLNK